MELRNRYYPLNNNPFVYYGLSISEPLVLKRYSKREHYIPEFIERLKFIPQVIPLDINQPKRRRFDHVINIIRIVDQINKIGVFDNNSIKMNNVKRGVLYHDLGHPSYGHAGERALNSLLQASNLNFSNSTQSIRILKNKSLSMNAKAGIFITQPITQAFFDESAKDFTYRVVDFLDDLENCLGDLIDLWRVFKSKTIYDLFREAFNYRLDDIKDFDKIQSVVVADIFKSYDKKYFIEQLVGEEMDFHKILKDIRKEIKCYIKKQEVIVAYDKESELKTKMIFDVICEDLQLNRTNPKQLRLAADIVSSTIIMDSING